MKYLNLPGKLLLKSKKDIHKDLNLFKNIILFNHAKTKKELDL